MKLQILGTCFATAAYLVLLGPVVAAGSHDARLLSELRLVQPSSTGWKPQHRMPGARVLAAVADVNGFIYVAGGIRSHPEATLFGYDTATKTWATLADMPGERYDGNGAAVIDGQIYVAGGWTRNPPLPNDNLYVYDPSSNTWSVKADMPNLSACGATGAIGGKLYVLTACDGNNGYSSEFNAYDPTADKWTGLASPSNSHGNPAFGVIGHTLIVAGGLDAAGVLEGTTEAYDPRSKSWTTLSPEPEPVMNAASAAVGDRLFVIGGNDGSAAVDAVQVYDISTDSWSMGTSLPTALTNAAAAVQQSYIFVEGGTDASGNERSNLRCRARRCGG